MKQFAFTILFAFLIFTSCNSSQSKKNASKESENTVAVVDVDQFLATPERYLEKTVNIKGLVVHTCKHSGKKMFLTGTDKNKFVKIIAGSSISRFDESLEGETVIATGTLTLLDESQEKHEESGEGRMKMAETSQDSSTSEYVTDTKIKKYQMICDRFTVVDD